MKEKKHNRVSQLQLDQWLENPVTLVYLECLKFEVEQVSQFLSDGSCIDSTNNDRSMNLTHSAMGSRLGLESASELEPLILKHDCLEVPLDEGTAV